MRSLGLALATLFVLLFPACGGKDEPEAPATSKPGATEAAAASVTPFPSIDMADLAAGTTYTTRQFKPNITLTLPEGEWKLLGADSPDHLEIEPTVKDPVDSSTVAFRHMTQVFDPETGGETPGDAVPGPEDFAEWLTDHPYLKSTRPKPVEALGLKGVSIDIRVRSSQPRRYKDCGKVT